MFRVIYDIPYILYTAEGGSDIYPLSNREHTITSPQFSSVLNINNAVAGSSFNTCRCSGSCQNVCGAAALITSCGMVWSPAEMNISYFS